MRGSKLNTLLLWQTLFHHESLQRKVLDQEESIRQTLQSYLIANDRLKEETGLVAVHLSHTTQIKAPLLIFDKMKIAHKMDPNHIPFIIQKRATLVKETISQLMDRGEVYAAKSALRSLFSLIKIRVDKGIEDSDPNLAKNFGFLDLIPIQIDGGRFSFASLPLEKRLSNSKEDLQHWINKHYPELSEDFNSAYEKFLKNSL